MLLQYVRLSYALKLLYALCDTECQVSVRGL
jgi:hypothetical protein